MILVKISGLRLLSLETLEKEKYLSSQRGSTELIQGVTGGVFVTADHLLELGGERHDRQKNQHDSNNVTLKSLVGDLLGTNWCLILWAKNTDACMSVRGTTVSDTVMLDTKICDVLFARYNVTPPQPIEPLWHM